MGCRQCRRVLYRVPQHVPSRLLALEATLGHLLNHLLHLCVPCLPDHHRLPLRVVFVQKQEDLIHTANLAAKNCMPAHSHCALHPHSW